MQRYEYMIVYEYKTADFKTGVGRVFIDTPTKLDNKEAVLTIEENIKEDNSFDEILITNFILLSEMRVVSGEQYDTI